MFHPNFPKIFDERNFSSNLSLIYFSWQSFQLNSNFIMCWQSFQPLWFVFNFSWQSFQLNPNFYCADNLFGWILICWHSFQLNSNYWRFSWLTVFFDGSTVMAIFLFYWKKMFLCRLFIIESCLFICTIKIFISLFER